MAALNTVLHKIIFVGAVGLVALLGLSLVGQCQRASVAEKAVVEWQDSVKARSVELAFLAMQAKADSAQADSAKRRYLREHEARLKSDAKVAMLLVDYNNARVPDTVLVPAACTPWEREASSCARTVAGLQENVANSQSEAKAARDEADAKAREAEDYKKARDNLQKTVNEFPKPAKRIHLPGLSIPFPSVGLGGVFTVDSLFKGKVYFKPGITVSFPIHLNKIF